MTWQSPSQRCDPIMMMAPILSGSHCVPSLLILRSDLFLFFQVLICGELSHPVLVVLTMEIVEISIVSTVP